MERFEGRSDWFQINLDWNGLLSNFGLVSDSFGLGPRIGKFWKSFGFIRIRVTDKTCVRIRFRINSNWNCCSKRVGRDWKSFGMRRIHSDWTSDWEGMKVCSDKCRIPSVWCQIQSDWNLKRLTDWKGFRRIKKSFGMRLKLMGVDRSDWNVFSTWIWSSRTD